MERGDDYNEVYTLSLGNASCLRRQNLHLAVPMRKDQQVQRDSPGALRKAEKPYQIAFFASGGGEGRKKGLKPVLDPLFGVEPFYVGLYM